MDRSLGRDFYIEKTEANQGNWWDMKFNWMVFDWLSLGFKFRNPEAFEDLDFGFFR